MVCRHQGPLPQPVVHHPLPKDHPLMPPGIEGIVVCKVQKLNVARTQDLEAVLSENHFNTAEASGICLESPRVTSCSLCELPELYCGSRTECGVYTLYESLGQMFRLIPRLPKLLVGCGGGREFLSFGEESGSLRVIKGTLKEKSPSFLSFLRPILTQHCKDFRNTITTGKSSSRGVQRVLKGCKDVASNKGLKRDNFGSKEARIPRKPSYHNDHLYDEDRKDKEYAKWVTIENDPIYDEDMKDREYAKWSLDNNAPCALCTTKLSTLLSYLTGPTVGNVSDCRAYTAIYAASLSDQYDPTSPGTAKCLFGLDFSSHSSGKCRAILISLVSVFCFLALLLFFSLWAYLRCNKRWGLLARGKETVLAFGLDSMNQSTTLISVANMECVVHGIIKTQLEHFDDFTLASSWERFTSEIEAVLRLWMSDGANNLLEKGAVLLEDSGNLYKVKSEMMYAMKSYCMEFYFRTDLDGKDDAGKLADWSFELHDLQLCFGVKEFLVWSLLLRVQVVWFLMREASKLLSAIAIALSNCSSLWPAFVPVHDPSRKAYIGIQSMGFELIAIWSEKMIQNSMEMAELENASPMTLKSC
ncbi:hypothetical protein Fmac_011169 [Flemingia macrophylla]|uniref:Uncharacterized protein n=1 Tax=Flemingia macrophylla TaxID=520843 RepID=A0ABD1MMH7_9FABA